jgi:hypothetical protein
MRTRFVLSSLTSWATALVLVASAMAQTPNQDSVRATGSAFPFDNVDITAQSSPSGQNASGTATVSLAGAGAFSGPVTCLSVTGPVATLNFQVSGGVLTAQVVDNGTGVPPDEIQVAAVDRAPTDCSPLAPGFGIDATFDHGGATVFDAPALPTSKDQCKNGGWRDFPGFKNQGDCVSFVATGGGNGPGGR